VVAENENGPLFQFLFGELAHLFREDFRKGRSPDPLDLMLYILENGHVVEPVTGSNAIGPPVLVGACAKLDEHGPSLFRRWRRGEGRGSR
jgi:hypothetical protein